MEKRYWAFLLAMLVLISGCGKGDSTDTDPQPESGATREEVTESTDSPPAETNADEHEFDDDVFTAKVDTATTTSADDGQAIKSILSTEEVQAIAKGRYERALEKIPPFDRDAAARKIMLEKYGINMDQFPEKPLSTKELRALFMSSLKLRADENFPPADREHVAKQAADQFPIYQKGDRIKLELARGIVEGTIEGVDSERIKVDGRIVLLRDVRKPSPETFDEARVQRRRQHYISLNYEQPRQQYIAKLDEAEREAFYERHFYVKGNTGWFRADQVFAGLKANEAAKLERQYMDEQRFLLRKKIEQELRDEGLWKK